MLNWFPPCPPKPLAKADWPFIVAKISHPHKVSIKDFKWSITTITQIDKKGDGVSSVSFNCQIMRLLLLVAVTVSVPITIAVVAVIPVAIAIPIVTVISIPVPISLALWNIHSHCPRRGKIA